MNNNSTPETAHHDLQQGSSDLAQEASTAAARRRIIEEIRAINSTAGPEFLDSFTTEALAEYLHHLSNVRQKGIRMRGWLQLRNAALVEARRQLRERRAA